MIEQAPVRLTLNRREAAAALGVSERLLWAMTAPRGPIPCIRLARRVLYAVADLETVLASHRVGGGR